MQALHAMLYFAFWLLCVFASTVLYACCKKSGDADKAWLEAWYKSNHEDYHTGANIGEEKHE